MATVKQGDRISIHYTGTLEDGSVFDSSEGRSPLEFTVGEGEIIKGLEDEVIGMALGETKTITIPTELAYGPRDEQRVFPFERKNLGEDVELDMGQQVQLYRADGMPLNVTVIGKTDTTYTFDCNHPLAGKTLIFKTTIAEIL
ncbi:MAG: FKBP-type peptidyl-prolyl cis-trans isomerase [Thermodesulfovibrionales bacterium]|jgi:peptidylprolyl isomerase